jgi:chromosome segregation protein
MHLTKISLFGFKSFADKVELSFEPGVTGVVGPNGCGKSNVSDAIRWALGEQSAKLLRGDRMDDLIFAGNGHRKPLGLAEVSLTFTRNGGALPTEYEEVNVTRRLYRSGESEYLLNKVPCRLRDITDLFIDTGLAGEPYALIEQGSIGSVVNARPADRRVLIEEAAGIMKYKTKRRAAGNKLESTEQNLLRIRDVIAEVERQRNSLKRQANKAERYKQLDVRATELKLFLKYREHAGLWEELQGILGRLGPAQQLLTGVRAGIGATEAALEERRLHAVTEERAVATAQESLFDLRNRSDRDEAELRNVIQQLADAARRQAEHEAALAGLGQTAQRLLASIEGGAATAAEHERDVTALEAKLEADGQAVRETDAILAAAVAALEQMRHQAAHRSGQLALKRNELATLLERHRQMTAQSERLRHQRAEAASQREGAEASSTAEETRRQEATERQSRALADREAAQVEAARAREARRHLENEIAGLVADVERQRGRLSSLRELRLEFADFSEGNKLLLQAGRDRRVGGILGPLAEALETAPRYEKALEAILGAHLQGVRVQTWREAQEALAHLFRSGQGRATLVGPTPTGEGTWGHRLHAELAAQVADLPKELLGQVEGLALDVIKSFEGATPWVAHLLADAVIVGTLDAALAVARELPGPFTLATLAGEVLTHRGTLTGGTPAPQGLLGQRRELRELEEALAISEVGLSGLREALAIVSEDVAGAERAVESAGMAERQADLDLLAIEKDLAARRADELRLSQQLELFGIELQTVEADLARIEREMGALRATLSEGEAAVAELHAGIAGREREATGLRERREEAAVSLNDQRVALASRVARRDETLRDLTRMRQELQAAEEQIGQFTREAAELTVRRAAQEVERDRLREGLAVLRRDEEERQAALVRAQETRAAGQETIARLEDELRAKRREESELSAEVAALDTRRGEVKATLARLELDLVEAHGLGTAELRERFAASDLEVETAKTELEELRVKLAELGPANLGALEEYQALCQRYEFLTTQAEDLTRSVTSLRQAIGEINKTIETLFNSTLDAVNQHFDHFWRRLIGGGSAQLRLVEPVEPDGDEISRPDDEPGVEMLVRFPGKRPTVLSLLSGGERALAALSLLLALFAVRPSPFCVLDEVDAPLDDTNVDRFVTLIREMAQQSQFIAITHNKRTMEAADLLYGVTMEEEGVSKVISVRMKAAA